MAGSCLPSTLDRESDDPNYKHRIDYGDGKTRTLEEAMQACLATQQLVAKTINDLLPRAGKFEKSLSKSQEAEDKGQKIISSIINQHGGTHLHIDLVKRQSAPYDMLITKEKLQAKSTGRRNGINSYNFGVQHMHNGGLTPYDEGTSFLFVITNGDCDTHIYYVPAAAASDPKMKLGLMGEGAKQNVTMSRPSICPAESKWFQFVYPPLSPEQQKKNLEEFKDAQEKKQQEQQQQRQKKK